MASRNRDSTRVRTGNHLGTDNAETQTAFEKNFNKSVFARDFDGTSFAWNSIFVVPASEMGRLQMD